MLNQWLLYFKSLLIISFFTTVYTWNPQCSPCRCFFGQNNKKISDCSSSVTSLPLTKIPELRPETETVILVGQQLPTIPQDAFFKGSSNNLNFVDLKNCKVRLIHAGAFRNLEYLSGLDLSHNALSELDENVFDLNNKLRILILQNNNFKVFPEKIFHNLPALKYLDISNNKLHYVHPTQFKSNTNLERLILQSNYLTNFDHVIISNLGKLNVLYLDHNPWKCDCQTKDLLKLIIDRNIEFVDNNDYPLCSKPKQWKGKKWLTVKPRDLCSVPKSPIVTISEGDSLDVDCNLEATNNDLAVEWLFNGQSLDTSNSQKYQLSSVKNSPNTYLYTLKINEVKFTDIGVYKCWTTNLKDSDVQYEETRVNVQSGNPPSISGPENESKLVKNGERDYKLPCDITGNPQPTVYWLFNGKELSFSEYDCQRRKSPDNSLLYSQINPSCFGNYTCRASNYKGVTEKKYELLALPQQPPKVAPVDQEIDNNNAVEGTSVSLNCYVSEPVQLKVQWLRNGQIILPNSKYTIRVNKVNANTYNYILTINDVSFNEGGNYKCSANSVESPEFTINVKPAQGPVIPDFENQNEITLKPGENKDIPCKATGSPKPTISWVLPQPDCNGDSFATGDTLHLINVNCPGRYKCIVTNSKGRAEKELYLTVLEPSISGTDIHTDYSESDNTISEYDDIILTCLIEASATSEPYWEFNNKRITNSNKYKLVRKPNGKNKYYYNLEIKNIAILDKGNYKCRLGSDYKSVDVDVKPSKVPTIDSISQPNTIVEEGAKDFKLECKVSGSHLNVIWTYNNENNCKYDQIIEDRGDYKVLVLVIKEVHSTCKGQYKCKASNKLGDDEKVVDLNVVPFELPEPTIESPHNNEVVENEVVTLKCLIRGAVKSEPRWLFNGNFDPNKYQIVKEKITETSYWYNLIIKDLKPEDGGNYKCVVGKHEINFPLNVKPSVEPNIEYISNSQTIEAGRKNFRIACKATGVPKPTTIWVKNGDYNDCKHEITEEVIGNGKWEYLIFPRVTSSCSGRYTCIATNSKGVSKIDVDITVISMDEPPKVTLDTPLIDNEVIENEDVVLKCFIKTHNYEPEWIKQGQVIRTNNKYRIEKVPFNQTAYWFNLIISNLSHQDKGHYKCRVNNFESGIDINVLQKSKKPVIESISNPNTVQEGKQDITLTCKVNGIPKPKVYWYYEGQQINKNQVNCKYTITSNVVGYTEWLYLTIRDVEKSCAGKYKCVAENFKGEEENEIDLSVVSAEPPEIIEPPKNIIENSNITLQCLIKDSIDSKPIWLHNDKPIDIKRNNKYKLYMMRLNDETSFLFNLEILNISPYETGRYKCKINNLETEISLTTQQGIKPQILLIPKPEIDLQAGKQVTLPCHVRGNPIPEITWLHNNIPIDPNMNNHCQYRITTETIGNQQQLNLTLQNVGPTCAGKYTCRSKNFKGTSQYDVNIRVISLPPPFVDTVTTGNQILENDNVTLRCRVPRQYSAEWYIKNEPLILEPNGRYSLNILPGNETTYYWYNLVISNLLSIDKGEYKCVIKISNTKTLESPISLDIQKPVKPTIEYIPTKSTVVSEGAKDFRLACKVSGVPKPQVSWQYEANSINSKLAGNHCKHTITTEVNGNSEWIYLTIAEVTPACTGTYKCVTSNSIGSTQNEINLSVTSSKLIPEIITTSTSSDGIIRENDNVTLRCLSTGNSRAEWYQNNRPINFRNDERYKLDIQNVNPMTTWTILTIQNVSLTDRGNYICKVNNADQTYYLDITRALVPSVEYLTNPKIIIDEGTERTVLPCKVTDSINYAAEWTFNGQPIDTSSCSDATVSYEKTRHFEWYNLTIVNITSSCSGQYKCIVRNSGNNVNGEINLTVLSYKPPQIDIRFNSPEKISREQDLVTLKCLITSCNTNAAKWIYNGKVITSDNKYKISQVIINETAYWYNLEIPNVSIQQSGNYKCSTERGEIVHTLKVHAGYKPIIELTSNTEMIVDDGTKEITIFCKAKGSPAPTIKWFLPQKEGTCRLQSYYENNSNNQINYLKITNLNPTCSGKYTCYASNSKGAVEKIINLTVMPTKRPEITINSTSPDDIIREGDDVTISCLATGRNNGQVNLFFKSKYGDNYDNLRFTTYEINPLTYRYDAIIKNITLKQAGTYSCKSGSTENVKIDVESGIAPIIEHIPNSENVVIYTNSKETTLFCKVSGVPRPEVTWLHYDKPLDLSKEAKCKYQIYSNNQWSNLTINDASESCAGYYKCVAKSFKGRTEKQIIVRVIHSEVPEINVKLDSNDGVITVNDKVTLRCLVKGDFNTPVDWLYNGQHITIDNKNHKIIKEKENDVSFWYNLQIERINLNQGGRYQCKTRTSLSNIDVNVVSTTKPIITLSPSSKVFVQSGAKELTLQCTEKGIPIPSGTWEYDGISVDKISECANRCQYKLTNLTIAGTNRLQLTITNIDETCSGKYKCIAENSAGKAEKIIDVVVIPPGQPIVNIQEPVTAIVNQDVTISCKVTSVDQPLIIWKYNDKTVNDRSKFIIVTKDNYSNLTIVNFKQSDYGSYTCQGNLNHLQNSKTISLQAKTEFAPVFISPKMIWDNFKIVGTDLVLIAKVKAYPRPELKWKIDDEPTINPDNTKYLFESSYINDDHYWFNQTIKDFNFINYNQLHVFTVKNKAGTARRNYFVQNDRTSEGGDRFSVTISEANEDWRGGIPIET